MFIREYIFRRSIFYCHVSLPEGNMSEKWWMDGRLLFFSGPFLKRWHVKKFSGGVGIKATHSHWKKTVRPWKLATSQRKFILQPQCFRYYVIVVSGRALSVKKSLKNKHGRSWTVWHKKRICQLFLLVWWVELRIRVQTVLTSWNVNSTHVSNTKTTY